MTVYVDELRVWANARVPFRQGSCHLTADAPNELHEFASRLGLKRAWFQNHRVAPHYDLTRGKRRRALALGASFVPGVEQILKRRRSE